MSTSREYAQRANEAAFDPDSTSQLFRLTGADASIALLAGAHILTLPGTVPAFMRFGAAAVAPTGATAVPGFWLEPGVPCGIVAGEAATLHGLLVGGVGPADVRVTRLL